MSNKYLKWSQVAHAKVWAGEAATAGAEAASPPQQNHENRGQPGSQGQQTSPELRLQTCCNKLLSLACVSPQGETGSTAALHMSVPGKISPATPDPLPAKRALATMLGHAMKWPHQLWGGAARSDLPSHPLQFPGVLLELGKCTTSAFEMPSK